MPELNPLGQPSSQDGFGLRILAAVLTAFLVLSCAVLLAGGGDMNAGRWVALVTLLLWLPIGYLNTKGRRENPRFQGQIWFSTFYVVNPLAVLVGTGGYASPYYPYLVLSGMACALFNPMPYVLFFEAVLGGAYFTFFLQQTSVTGFATLVALLRVAAMLASGISFRYFLDALQTANTALLDYQERLEASHSVLEAQARQLAQSHHHMNHLADQSEGLIQILANGESDLASGPLDLISNLFWPLGPTYVFLGKGPVGRLFRHLGDRLESVAAEVQLAVSLPPSGGTLIFNEVGEPLFHGLHLDAPRNMVAYCRGELTLMALDYPGAVGELEAHFLKNLAVHGQFLELVAGNRQELERAFLYTIGALARASEANDEGTGNHIVRVNAYAERLARHLGASEPFVQTIAYSAQMHDVGKIHVSPLLLRKTGPLTPDEFEEMKRHTLYGPRILGESPRLQMAREIAIAHHEKWDGSGYPYGLRGEAIPMSARIVAMSDIYDALRSRRSYKPGFSHVRTAEILLEGDGRVMPSHFDPQVLEAFRRTQPEFEEIYERLRDDRSELVGAGL